MAMRKTSQKSRPWACAVGLGVLAFFCILGSIPFFNTNVLGQSELSEQPTNGIFNVPTYTFGGKQLWTDYVHFRGWRIQQNAYTKHFRLIDPRNIRQAWGSLAQCANRLETIKAEQNLPPLSGGILLLVHGLGRSRSSMNSLAEKLCTDREVEVINFSYASTRASMNDHALALQSVIEQLPKDCSIDIVAHSLGALVLRRYLFNLTGAFPDRSSDPPIHRIVMLGPPNNGAELAKKMRRTGIFAVVMGKSATQIADLKSTETALELGVPRVEFGIIAGNGSIGPLTNPLLAGDNDFFVGVEETRLAGASDFIVLPVAHGFMLSDANVHRAVGSFLDNGYFLSAESRQPIGEDPQSTGSSVAPTK